jgi:hypothetical protein
VRKGSLVPEAAGVVHTDFEKGFIRAQVYGIADLEEYRSEAALKTAGKLRVEGKTYEVKNGKIMHFLLFDHRGERDSRPMSRKGSRDWKAGCEIAKAVVPWLVRGSR